MRMITQHILKKIMQNLLIKICLFYILSKRRRCKNIMKCDKFHEKVINWSSLFVRELLCGY